MARLVLIADDLTGALDGAAPFAAVSGGVAVAASVAYLPAALATGAAVVAVSTRSREAGADRARDRVAQVRAALPPGARLFKKIDSRLKGPIAAELSCLDGPLLVAPAIPDFGRTVSAGAVRGFGVDRPLPVAPVLGAAAARAVVPDTETAADMDAALRAAPDDAVLVGARGLAQALAAAWGLAPVTLDAALPAPACFVVGSTDPITRAQVAALAGTATLIEAPGGRLPPPPPRLSRATVLCTALAQDDAGRVAAAFAGGAAPWVAAARGVLLTGGATAEAVLDRLGAGVLRLLGEALPGLPVARAGGRVYVTKSGGFGAPDALRRLLPADGLATAGA